MKLHFNSLQAGLKALDASPIAAGQPSQLGQSRHAALQGTVLVDAAAPNPQAVVPAKIAYLLLVHRYPDQFKRLFKAIHDPDNTYLVHVDKNSGAALRSDIGDFLRGYPNAALLKSEGALWGGYSLVDAELRGMERLLEMDGDWEFFINLSGQDFPLATQRQIRTFLGANRGKEFIRVLNQSELRPETMGRVLQHVVELKDRIVDSLATRNFLEGATPYIGNQWKIVSREFCQFVCHDPLVERYKAFYRNTLIADEGFFQTVMMNSDAHGEIINDDLRMIDWVPDGDIKLRPRTYRTKDAPELTASSNLFARKFDTEEDAEIVGILEAHLYALNALDQDACLSTRTPSEVLAKALKGLAYDRLPAGETGFAPKHPLALEASDAALRN